MIELTAATITDAQIEALRAEALQADDDLMVDACDEATSAAVAKHRPGARVRSRELCAEAINSARAQEKL